MRSHKITIAYNRTSEVAWVLNYCFSQEGQKGFRWRPLGYNRPCSDTPLYHSSLEAVTAMQQVNQSIQIIDVWNYAELAAWMQKEFGAAYKNVSEVFEAGFKAGTEDAQELPSEKEGWQHYFKKHLDGIMEPRITDGFYVVYEPEFPDVLFAAQHLDGKWYIPNREGPYKGKLVVQSHICTTRPVPMPDAKEGKTQQEEGGIAALSPYWLLRSKEVFLESLKQFKQEPEVTIHLDRYRELLRKEEMFEAVEKRINPEYKIANRTPLRYP